MTHLLERLRPRKIFFKVDILSCFGETICLPEVEIPDQVGEKRAQAIIEARAWEEEPERWDGLS